MKNLIKTLIIALTFTLIYSSSLFSQEVSKDSLKTGKLYKILLTDSTWLVGEVTSIDSVNITFKKTTGRTTVLYKEHIKTILVLAPEVVTEYYKKIPVNKTISKPFFTIGGGMALKSFLDNGPEGSTSNTYIVDGEGTVFFGRNSAARLNINCNFTGSSDYGYYMTGSNTSVYLVSIDVLAGNLKPESITNSYFTGGLSALIYSESDEVYTDYSGRTYTYHGETETYIGPKLGYGIKYKASQNIIIGGEILYATPFQSFFTVGAFSLKPSVHLKVSKNLGVYLEPQYSFPVAFGDWGGFFVDLGYFTLKSGITYNLF
jgi:hypothetical protein